LGKTWEKLGKSWENLAKIGKNWQKPTKIRHSLNSGAKRGLGFNKNQQKINKVLVSQGF